MRKAPLHVIWWLVSRASGVVALVLLSLTVLAGLAMAARVLPRGRVTRAVLRLHEHMALAGLTAVAVHGLALLGDRWLHPGVTGISVPFALSYRPVFTGLGIIAGYLALLVGPSFYLRRRLGPGRWRKAHRLGAGVWVLGAVHTLGAGSDGSTLWLRSIVFAPAVALVYLGVVRVLPASTARGKKAAPGRAEVKHRRPAARTGQTAEATRATA